MTPLVILVGFLGAGKTTYLRHLLPKLSELGLDPFVIINDYENARVDAELLNGLVAFIQPISGSCVCCGSREELIDALAGFDHQKNRVLIVETNGTTDSEDLIEMLSLNSSLRQFTLPIQVSVIDAKRWQKRFWHNSLELDQARTANFIYLSKQEEIESRRMIQVTDSFAKHSITGALKSPAEFAAELLILTRSVNQTPLRPFEEHSANCSCGHHHEADHHEHDHNHEHHHFASSQLRLPPLLDKQKLESFLATLGEEVIRAKGIVRFSETPNEYHVFQKTDRGSVQFLPIGVPRIEPETVAVFIGPHIDEAHLKANAAKHLSSQ